MDELTGKTALVTGAARRIGHAISVGLAKQGVSIIAHYNTSEEEAKKLKSELTDLGVDAWLFRADFTKPDSHRILIESAYKVSGKIDILVNNASIFYADRHDVGLDDININMMVNAWTPFVLGNYFSEKVARGKIINLLDTRISGYDFNHFAYYLSKRMLEILTRSMALKLAPRFNVNGIAPGLILPPEGKDYSYLEQRKDTVPLRRSGSVSDVVEAAVFLLRNDFITGEVIHVDGGKHLIQTIEGI